MEFSVSCGLVAYKNDRVLLENAINSFLKTSLEGTLFFIDNSPTDELKTISKLPGFKYIANPLNPGFGAAHNIGINRANLTGSKYHLILNPDIYFEEGILEELVDYLEKNPTVGVVMPKILYPDNSLQKVARLLPSPIDFFVRRFLPFKFIQKRIDARYELHDYKYDKPLFVPFLSGCFMLFRTSVLNDIKGFDENIFMYTEDIDICRRVIDNGFETMVYPQVSVYHDHVKKSFLNFKNLTVYTKSAIYYFNKWGWIFDSKRKKNNDKTLDQLK